MKHIFCAAAGGTFACIALANTTWSTVGEKKSCGHCEQNASI